MNENEPEIEMDMNRPKIKARSLDRNRFAVVPVKIMRSLIYISREIREILGWRTEDDLQAIIVGKILILFKEDVNSIKDIKEALKKALEFFSE